MIRRPPRSTQSRSSAASDVYKRQAHGRRRSSVRETARVRAVYPRAAEAYARQRTYCSAMLRCRYHPREIAGPCSFGAARLGCPRDMSGLPGSIYEASRTAYRVCYRPRRVPRYFPRCVREAGTLLRRRLRRGTHRGPSAERALAVIKSCASHGSPGAGDTFYLGQPCD